MGLALGEASVATAWGKPPCLHKPPKNSRGLPPMPLRRLPADDSSIVPHPPLVNPLPLSSLAHGASPALAPTPRARTGTTPSAWVGCPCGGRAWAWQRVLVPYDACGFWVRLACAYCLRSCQPCEAGRPFPKRRPRKLPAPCRLLGRSCPYCRAL